MPFLAGQRIELDPLDPATEDHVEVYFRSRNEPSMRATGAYGRAMTWGQARDQLETMQQTDDPNALCVVRRENEAIGWAGTHLHDTRARVANVGYYILPAHQGNGYASEAARLLVTYAFEELNAHSVRAEAQADNPASERVLEKLGFQCEGTKRAVYYKNGEYKDFSLWSILRAEFEKQGNE